MPVTKLVEPSEADASLKDVLAAAEKHFGHVPNLVKALANNPDMCNSITSFLIQALGPGRIDWGLKELIILKTLRSNGNFYSYGAHERLASELGVSSEKIGDVANSLWQDSPHFNDGERVLFELVEQIAEDANACDDLWGRLRANWDNGQLLEVNAIITTFVMIGRMGDTLGISDPVLFTRDVSNGKSH